MKAAAEAKKLLKLALKRRIELRLANTTDVSVLLLIHWHLYSPHFPLLVHEELGQKLTLLGNIATSKT